MDDSEYVKSSRVSHIGDTMSGSESLSSSLGEDQPLSEFLGHDTAGNAVVSTHDATVQQPVITSPSSDQLHFQVQIVVRPMTEAPGGADVTVTALSAGDLQMLTPSRDSVVPGISQHTIGGRDGARTPRPGARSPARTALSLPLIDNHATQRINLIPSTPVPWNSGTALRSPSPARNYGGRPANTVSPRRATIPATRPSRRIVSKTGSQAGSSSDTGSCSKPSEANAEQVTAYLRTHPEFLERWIMEEVELEQLERWMIRRTQRDKKRLGGDANGKVGRKTSLSRWKFCVHADKRQMLQELTQALQLRPNRAHVLWELSSCICSAVSADGFRLYLAEQAASRSPTNGDGGNGELMDHYLGHDLRLEGGEPTTLPVSQPVTVAEFVARSREPLRLSRGDGDPRFPAPAPEAAGKDDAILEATHALWQPMVQADGSLAGVLLMWRRQTPAFHEEDEEIARSYLVWGGIALHYAQLFLSMDKARRLNDFLLHVVKSIFQDMVSMDALVVKVMNFAQRLVDADRASLFLLDARNKELYARIFDMGHKPEVPQTDEATATAAKEIRFPLGTGIAGQVALTGEVLNITDAYSDPRFNRTVDQLTGYHTRSILCMPIFIRGLVIGVVQMVNKRSGNFTKEDEEAFETFAVYCGLALHHAKLYDKIQRSEQKYRVALEVLSYHNTCSDDEVLQIRGNANDPPLMDPNACDYRFNVFALDDVQKVRCSIIMFSELFGLSRFDQDSLIRFTLTVRKNYRRVPYHNWTHGFSVANSMYSIIKHSQNAFNANESLALYIGSLCHDLDHRGKNNKFMLDTESPLACIYSTSTMEHHHFNQTVTILQQEGHNIFSKLSGDEYKQVLGHIKHCILATDLAIFFPNKARLSQLVADKQFSWSEPEHRLLLEALAMTASDLSASAKPWDLQVKTVKVIFEEFYEQGDAERAAGRVPIPMMDRNQPDQQAASQGDEEKLAGRVPNPHMDRAHQGRLAEMQVGFLNGICLPCYRLLAELLPGTKPLLEGCEANLARWQQIIEDQKKSKKQIEDTT